MKLHLPWQRDFWHGVASVLDTGGTVVPDRPMTDEEAFAYDREMLTRDWEAILGPQEEWRKSDGLQRQD